MRTRNKLKNLRLEIVRCLSGRIKIADRKGLLHQTDRVLGRLKKLNCGYVRFPPSPGHAEEVDTVRGFAECSLELGELLQVLPSFAGEEGGSTCLQLRGTLAAYSMRIEGFLQDSKPGRSGLPLPSEKLNETLALLLAVRLHNLARQAFDYNSKNNPYGKAFAKLWMASFQKNGEAISRNARYLVQFTGNTAQRVHQVYLETLFAALTWLTTLGDGRNRNIVTGSILREVCDLITTVPLGRPQLNSILVLLNILKSKADIGDTLRSQIETIQQRKGLGSQRSRSRKMSLRESQDSVPTFNDAVASMA